MSNTTYSTVEKYGSYGIIIVLYAKEDAAPGAVIERSLNGVSGWEEVGFIPSVLRIGDYFLDTLPNDGVTRFYRARHVWDVGEPGPYTNVVAAEPIFVNPSLDLNARPWPTSVPLNLRIDITPDGSGSLFLDGSFRTKSVRYAVNIDSADLPLVVSGTIYNLTGSVDAVDDAGNLLGITTITSGTLNTVLSDGQLIRAGAQFFTEIDAGGRLLGTHYDLSRYIAPTGGLKREPDFNVSLVYFNSGSGDNPYVKVVLDVDDYINSLNRVMYYWNEGPISELPNISTYTSWSVDTVGTYSGSYTQDVALSEKHLGVLAFAGYWNDINNTERVTSKVLWLDVGDNANIIYLVVSYDDNGSTALIEVRGDADTQELRAQEFISGSWTTVASPTPSFTDTTRFSSTRTGSFSVVTDINQRRFRAWGRNANDIDGPFNEFSINSSLDITGGGSTAVSIIGVEGIEAQSGSLSLDDRSILVTFRATSEVESIRFLNNRITAGSPDLDSSYLAVSSSWTPLSGDLYTWVITDDSGVPIDFPARTYGSDIGITLVPYSNISGSEPSLGSAVTVFNLNAFFPTGLAWNNGSTGVVSNQVFVGQGLLLNATAIPSISLDLSTLDTPLGVPQGGTGLSVIPSGSLLLGNGIDDLELLPPPNSGGTKRYLAASGSLTTPQFEWVENAGSINTVSASLGLAASSTSGPNVSITPLLYGGVDVGYGHLELAPNGSMAVVLGSTGNTAAAGNHTHSGFALSTRNINTGTGLTGGGNLTADRTLELTGQALALHNLGTNGIIVRTGAGTVAARTLTGSTHISVTNGDGVSGNPTVSVASTVVITSTNQTIAGTKTFSNLVELNQASVSGTAPSGNNVASVTVSTSTPSGDPGRIGHFWARV